MRQLVEWFTFGAEVAVAVVIYLEVENSRRDKFFEIASNPTKNEARRELYRKFLALTGDRHERARKFSAMIETDENLRKEAINQIAFVNDLGFLARRRFPNWVYIFGENPVVKLLPHMVIYTWAMLSPVIQRRRNLTGEWYATPLLQLTLRSIDLMLDSSGGQLLTLGEGVENRLEIDGPDLRAIRAEVNTLLQHVPRAFR